MKLNPLDFPICLEPPRRYSGMSAWQPHVPFGMFLVAATLPHTIVELGTHYGDSYCAFCQAVDELDLDARCYAVDTWEGDEHSGFYGPEVLDDLRAHHDPLYSKFSTLLQMQFDEAVKHFQDRSIDLLHIDGCHTYEAVKHDFETWAPKVSDRGIVLFHDVNVYEGNFGVWRLWDELTPRYPSFTFYHGSGLGLLCVGVQIPPVVRTLVEADPEEAAAIRRFFHELGGRTAEPWAARGKAVAAWAEVAKAQIDAIHGRLSVLEATAAESGEIRTLGQHLEELSQLMEVVRAQLAGLLAQVSEYEERVSIQETAMAANQGATARRLEELNEGLRVCNDHLVNLQQRVDQVSAELGKQGAFVLELLGLKRDLESPLTLRRFVAWQRLAFRRIRRKRSDFVAYCDVPDLATVALTGPTLEVRGWAASPHGIRSVEVFLDDQLLGELDYGLPRPDVRSHHPRIPGSGESGFHGQFDLSHLPPGRHRLRLRVLDGKGYPKELGGDIELDPHLPSTQPPPGSSDILFHCDVPDLATVALTGPTLEVRGWAASPHGIRSVDVFLDDELLGELDYGLPRPDVRSHHPRIPGSGESGFHGQFDLSHLPPGRHRLRLRAIGEHGRSAQGEGDIDLDPSLPKVRELHLPDIDHQYQRWLSQHSMTPDRLRALAAAASRLPYKPLFSILMPVWNPPPDVLRLAIDSVINQAYPHWELCIADDGSTATDVHEVLQDAAKRDQRIRLKFSNVNTGISNALNRALELAGGEFIGLLDHDDILWPNALYECAKLVNDQPDADLIYSDEDKISADGRHYEPFFKPDWSPKLLTNLMYIGHFTVYRTSIVHQVGGFRKEFDGSQDYDLALRVTEQTKRIHHVPTVLYSWRALPASAAASVDAKPYALAAAKAALQQAMARRGIEGRVEAKVDQVGAPTGTWNIRYQLNGAAPITLLMPTGGNVSCLAKAIDGILNRTDHRDLKLLVVDNSNTAEVRELIARLTAKDGRLEYMELRERPFNFSQLVNRAVGRAQTRYIGIVNDDIDVISGDWLTAMLELAQLPEVGVVGAKLLYPGGTIQHAGVALGIGGVAGHLFRGLPANWPGPFALAEVTRNCSAVTFACAAMRRDVYCEVGGLDEVNLPVAFNDVDFCLRARQHGYEVVYTPNAVLYHYESATRHRLALDPAEVHFMQEVWAKEIERDPYYNPNLTRLGGDFSLATQ